MTESNNGYPNHPTRTETEQELHDHIIDVLVEQLESNGFEDVRTNPGESQANVIEVEEQTELCPDLFAVEGEEVTAICEVETPATVHENAVRQWQDYAALDSTFLLVVPEEHADVAREILEANEVECDQLIAYQLSAEGEDGNDNGSDDSES